MLVNVLEVGGLEVVVGVIAPSVCAGSSVGKQHMHCRFSVQTIGSVAVAGSVLKKRPTPFS